MRYQGEGMKQYISETIIKDFFERLNDSRIRYILIKNIAAELPCRLKPGKDIDLLIAKEDEGLVRSFLKKQGYRRVEHPWGRTHGWDFLYGLDEFQFWEKEIEGDRIRIDICYSLACKGVMPNVWIPLDRKIQNSAWEKRLWDDQNNWWILDDDTLFCYLIARCIFDKRGFSAEYIQEIQRVYEHVDLEKTKELLSCVFFKYTLRLLKFVEDNRFEDIVKDYFAFCDY